VHFPHIPTFSPISPCSLVGWPSQWHRWNPLDKAHPTVWSAASATHWSPHHARRQPGPLGHVKGTKARLMPPPPPHKSDSSLDCSQRAPKGDEPGQPKGFHFWLQPEHDLGVARGGTCNSCPPPLKTPKCPRGGVGSKEPRWAPHPTHNPTTLGSWGGWGLVP
jgi:hypothetical protein